MVLVAECAAALLANLRTAGILPTAAEAAAEEAAQEAAAQSDAAVTAVATAAGAEAGTAAETGGAGAAAATAAAGAGAGIHESAEEVPSFFTREQKFGSSPGGGGVFATGQSPGSGGTLDAESLVERRAKAAARQKAVMAQMVARQLAFEAAAKEGRGFHLSTSHLNLS